MVKIAKVWSREILDSRGSPTVETAVQAEDGKVAVASVPSGASTGSHEALELRDEDMNRYLGKGVLKAVSAVNQVLGPQMVGMDPTDQTSVDNKLIKIDGTKNKSKYGGNSILSISMAVCKLGASVSGKTLYDFVNLLSKNIGLTTNIKIPTPIFNMINGGIHGAGNLDFQEFHVIPATSKKFSESLRMGVETYLIIGKDLKRRGAIRSVGDEGGYAPNLFTNADALEIFVEAIQQTSYQLGRDVFLGLDAAASIFYKNGKYEIRDKNESLSDEDLLNYYKFINNQYHLAMLEDPFFEDAWESWKKITQTLGSEIIIVGDDLLATNPERVAKAIKSLACNAILVKPNQIGTVTESLQVIKQAKDAGWKVIVSHRSGETNDWFIADFAVGVGADYVKFGAPARGERVAKYNRLSSIEAELQQVQK